MSEKTYTHMDKVDWGEGPWLDEPDKVQWTDEATGRPCLAVRNRMGAWCGYSGVERDHPDYGKEYDKLESEIDVHGGITFAAPCNDDMPEDKSVCHVPEPGQTDDVWWFGFDCAHAFDLVPYMAAKYDDLELGKNDAYRDLPYVRSEVTKLARQLSDREPAHEPAHNPHTPQRAGS